MPFDLATAFAVREREDGLLERDTFDLGTAIPVEKTPKLSLAQKVVSNPKVSKIIDILSGGMSLEESEKLRKDMLGPLMKIPELFLGATEVPGVQKAAIPTEKAVETAGELGSFVLTTLGRAPMGIKAGAGAVIEGKPIAEVTQGIMKGFLKPEEVESIISKTPFQDWEQGAWYRLIPRAGAEAIETYLLYELVYGNYVAKFKNAYQEAKTQGAMQELDKMTTTIAKKVVQDPEKFKIKFPEDFTLGDKLGLTKAYLQNRLGVIPKVGDVLVERQSFLNLLKKTLGTKRGETFIPEVGKIGSFEGKAIKILKIEGQRVELEFLAEKGKVIVATLSQLSVPEVPKPTGAEAPKPTEEVVSPELKDVESKIQFEKLHKEYVRAMPVGEIISKSATIKQEIANEDFLIRTYEQDIAKLERQIELGEYQVEAEKAKAQTNLQVLKDKYSLAKETQRQRKAYRDEVVGLVKDISAAPKENIAIEYQETIEQLKSKFDLKRRTEVTKTKRESMKAFVERMKVEGKPIEIPADKLAMLEKTNIEDMTLDQLREVKTTIDKLTQLGKTKLKAREAIYQATKERVKQELLKEVTPIKSKLMPKVPIGEQVKTSVENIIKAQNYVQKTKVGLTPIDGLADVTGMTPMKKVLDTDYSKYLGYNDETIKEWYGLTKDFTEKEFDRIGVMAIARQEGGLERLANSGITEAEVKTIKLTPIEEKVYKFVVDTFDKEYPAVKAYSKDVYNADVGEQENYVSFMSDYEQLSDLEIYERFGQTPEQIASRKTKTVEQGFTKERAVVSKIKLETNIDKIFRRHMDDVAYMLNAGKNIKMYFEIINSPEMREKLGDVGTLAWLQWLDLMARKGGTEGAKRIAALDLLRRNIGAGVLSFRLSSALVQFSSFADTIATIGTEWATKGATNIAISPEWRNFIIDNFPEVRKAIGDDIAFREFGEGFMGNLTRIGTKPLQVLDGLMRSVAASGSYEKLCAEKGIAVDLSNPNPELIVEATRLMRQSQGSSFFKDQPLGITAGYGLTDNKSVNKLILTFQSFMLNRWDNINRQIWRMGIKEKNYKKAIASVFWLLIFAGAVEEGIRRGTRKITGMFAQEKQKEKNFITNSILNIVQSVPLFGQLASSITYSSNPVPVINTIDSLLSGITSIVKGKAKETKLKGLINTIGAAGALGGVPGSSQAAQIIRDIVPKPQKGLKSSTGLKSSYKLKRSK